MVTESAMIWNDMDTIFSTCWVCLFTKFRWRLHRALRLAWITWIPFILWFSMIFKIGLNIVHGFMNATFIDDSLCQWSLTINVHSCIYEHTSCMINDHRNSYEHWSSMIIDIDYDSWRSMIVAMKCCWSYMISVDHCIISWTLVCTGFPFQRMRILNPTRIYSKSKSKRNFKKMELVFILLVYLAI